MRIATSTPTPDRTWRTFTDRDAHLDQITSDLLTDQLTDDDPTRW